MKASTYQELAKRTLIDKPDFVLTDTEAMIIWCTIGLTGEAGEVAELIKKGILHQHGLDRAALKKEIGDTLWYIAGLCSKLNFDMDEIMQANINKLLERYPDGFSPEDSKRRVDV